MRYLPMRRRRRRKRRRKLSKFPAFLLSILKLLIPFVAVALGFALISTFKAGVGEQVVVPPFRIWDNVVAYWGGMTGIQRIIVVVSGLFMYSALFQVLFSWEKGIPAFLMFLSPFYGYLLFTTAGKKILIGGDLFIILVVIAEIALFLSYKIIKEKDWKESFAILGIQLLIVPGIAIAGLVMGVGMSAIPGGNENEGIRYAYQILAFLMLLAFQVSIFFEDGERSFKIEDPLNLMTGSEVFIDEDGGDIDVSAM